MLTGGPTKTTQEGDKKSVTNKSATKKSATKKTAK